jgi:hypothetical protein
MSIITELTPGSRICPPDHASGQKLLRQFISVTPDTRDCKLSAGAASRRPLTRGGVVILNTTALNKARWTLVPAFGSDNSRPLDHRQDCNPGSNLVEVSKIPT